MNTLAPSNEKSRLHELDALRFVAALSVVVYHMTYSNGATQRFPEVAAVTRFGYIGVNLFFIISGFVILWSAQGRSPVAFAISRFSRLYPIFWVAIAATSAVLWHHGTITVRQMLLNSTMVSGYLGVDYIDGVYWTLQVELKFYVVIFLLLIVGQINNAEKWAYGWIALTAIASVSHVVPGSPILYPFGSYFAAGMILFQIWTNGLTPVRGFALAASLVLSMNHATAQVDGFVYQLTGARWIPAAIIACAYFVLLGIATRRIKVGSPKLCTVLGASTYPLYLLHNRIGKEVFGALTFDRWVSLAVTLLAIAAITAVATGVDRKLHRFASRRLTEWSIRMRLQPGPQGASSTS